MIEVAKGFGAKRFGAKSDGAEQATIQAGPDDGVRRAQARPRAGAEAAADPTRECRTGIVGSAGRDGPLRGLAGSGIADRFRAWTGRSGRRYVFSVFPLDGGSEAEDLPLDGSAVVIGVERRQDGTRRPVFVTESDAAPDVLLHSGPVQALRARRGGELHMHLTAADGAQRRGIVADLAG